MYAARRRGESSGGRCGLALLLGDPEQYRAGPTRIVILASGWAAAALGMFSQVGNFPGL